MESVPADGTNGAAKNETLARPAGSSRMKLHPLPVRAEEGRRVRCWHEAAVRRGAKLRPVSGVQRTRNARCEPFSN